MESDYNGNATQEFPYWQPLLAIEIILNFAVIIPSTLFWNLTVFTAFIRSKLGNKPLTVLYSSLLLVLCGDKIVAAITTTTASPDVLRFWCILCWFFSIDNHLPERATATNHPREETMEQLQKDHPLRWSKLSSCNILVYSSTR